MRPSVTVAVAACGETDALARCLEALAAGDDRPDEVVVVDQAPSDATARVVAGIATMSCRYVTQIRSGLSASRNLALSLTTSDVLATTDADCVPDAGWVAAIRRSFAADRPPSACTGPVTAARPPRPGEFVVAQRSSRPSSSLRGRHTPWRVGTGGNFAASTTLLRDVAGWDERLGVGTSGRAGEDIELIDRLLRRDGVVIRVDPEQRMGHEPRDAAARLETRSTYGFGIGAFLGLRVRALDRHAAPMVVDYLRMHLVPLINALLRRDSFDVRQHWRALSALGPGFLYGMRIGPRRSPSVEP